MAYITIHFKFSLVTASIQLTTGGNILILVGIIIIIISFCKILREFYNYNYTKVRHSIFMMDDRVVLYDATVTTNAHFYHQQSNLSYLCSLNLLDGVL